MISINPTAFFANFLKSIRGKHDSAAPLWNVGWKDWKSKPWTAMMTGILVDATAATLQDYSALQPQVAAKGHPDRYGGKEYLSLDVTGYFDANWGPPCVIVEHENRERSSAIVRGSYSPLMQGSVC